jgi:hypothetical protein
VAKKKTEVEPKEKKPPDKMPIQMVIDPTTGKDITSEVISRRLRELNIKADEIISLSLKEVKKFPNKKMEIYEKFYWEIHQRLGVGSIGPVTAAAGPLMYKKLDLLAEKLEIREKDKLK